MNILRFIARPLLAAPFIIDGIDALNRPALHVDRSRALAELANPALDKAGVKVSDRDLMTASRVMGAVSVLAGVGLASGIAPRTSAAVLCALSVPVAAIHAPHAMRERDLGDFARRLAMIGALGIAATDRVGSPSAAWRVNSWLEDRRRERSLSVEPHV